jgi:hypothetical protein
MLDNDTLVKVTNRTGGRVGYTIPDLGLHRDYQPNETKEVTMNELRKLSYLPGGQVILEDYLVIKNADAVAELIPNAEPEYNYSKEDVIKLLTEGSIEQFLDALDFAPVGVIDLIKDLAVELKINSIDKRDAIKEKTGFDVTKAIQINKETLEETTEVENTGRRAIPINEEQKKTQEQPVLRRRVVE